MAHGKLLRQCLLQWSCSLSALLAVITLVLMSVTVARAQTYTVLYSFCPTHVDTCPGGDYPISLTQATDGNFYGTTSFGGSPETAICSTSAGDTGCGTVFKITPSGTLTTLQWFCARQSCRDGLFPTPLIQATNGDFYGGTERGGSDRSGTLFEINSGGDLTTLYDFCSQPNCADGVLPAVALMQATDGDLYGVAPGGANEGGTIFKISPGGQFASVYNFCSQPNCTDGEGPAAALIQAANGDFYGTTSEGGANGGGTFFKISPGGEMTTIYSFCSQPNCADGSFPFAALIQATNGDFYGTTGVGGAYNSTECNNSLGIGCGTVFRITPSGALTTLHSFDGTDGFDPSTLIQATNGDFYGTTFNGGTGRGGTTFEITPGGKLTTLYTFCSQPKCADGGHANALIQATNGELYGTSTIGGSNTRGTIFSIDVGLGPFVALRTSFGVVGATVTILGTDLTGATSVTFNGTPATFTVNSTGTAITATVPAGATTGTVQVVTPNGTLQGNVVYRVR